MVSTRRLVQIAAWGGLFVSTTGFYLQHRLVDKVRSQEYYKDALKTLRTNKGAVFYLGEPIKDYRFKLTDMKNNYADDKSIRLCVPVSGSKEKGSYYFWSENQDNQWKLVKAELELRSKPDVRLSIYQTNTE